ncbi:hypothetical protein ACIPVK_16280 [Paeniglutamicibacter sp. MACA_103]|uniref:hypothetical protein n=1 Tax=Paeniglutamicibacter sp. MACA_103 TaxID=3377337 RepID=UPI0038959E6C
MSAIKQVTNAMRGRQTINPKTVLGFYATVLGILLFATVSVVAVLASNNVELWLIPFLLGFSGLLLLLLLAGVFVVSLIDPSKLMLTQVTGTEYAHIQETLILGDSNRGDRVESFPVLEVTESDVELERGPGTAVAPTGLVADEVVEEPDAYGSDNEVREGFGK